MELYREMPINVQYCKRTFCRVPVWPALFVEENHHKVSLGHYFTPSWVDAIRNYLRSVKSMENAISKKFQSMRFRIEIIRSRVKIIICYPNKNNNTCEPLYITGTDWVKMPFSRES